MDPRGSRRTALVAPFAVLLAALACAEDESIGPAPCDEAEILSAQVAGNPTNVLSAVVTARVLQADSVIVVFGQSAALLDGRTIAVVPQGDSAVIPVLSLLPSASYRLHAVAYGDCGAVESADLDFQTDALPADLPTYSAGGSAPTDGFVVFAVGAYGVVIDNTGRIVWYHRFASSPGLNFQAQANGRYVARPPVPADPTAPWLEVDVFGRLTRSLGCARGLLARFHDLLMAPDGSYWVMCDEARTMDLSALSGDPVARVTGTAIQHIAANGALLFEWSPFDHFAITDLPQADRRGPSVNWTHGNALDLDRDGNLLVSFRSLNEITKIDTRTGAVTWRMGGLANQFTFPEGPPIPFRGQHGVRVAPDGSVLLLDNLGEPSGSRAERYQIDESTRTARLLRAFSPDVPVTAQVGGTTQSLTGGHALVSFGSGARVEEFDDAGASVWRIYGNPGYVFRAQRIRSLYSPGVGSPR